VGTKIIKLSTL